MQDNFPGKSYEAALSFWCSVSGVFQPNGNGESAHRQNVWDKITAVKSDSLFHHGDNEHDQVHLLVSGSQHSEDWLNAFPITAVGLLLSDETIRVTVGLRLGSRHRCTCGKAVDVRGTGTLFPKVQVDISATSLNDII